MKYYYLLSNSARLNGKNQFRFIKLIRQTFSSIGWHIYCASKICWWSAKDNEPRKSVVSIWTRYASVDFCLSYCKSTDFTTALHPHLPLIIFYAMKKRWHVENYVKRKKCCKSSSAAILSLKTYQIADESKTLKNKTKLPVFLFILIFKIFFVLYLILQPLRNYLIIFYTNNLNTSDSKSRLNKHFATFWSKICFNTSRHSICKLFIENQEVRGYQWVWISLYSSRN